MPQIRVDRMTFRKIQPAQCIRYAGEVNVYVGTLLRSLLRSCTGGVPAEYRRTCWV